MQAIATPAKRFADGHRAPVFPMGYILPFALVTALFFIWGMSNNLTDILVQQFKKSFDLSPLQAQLVKTAVFFGYACVPIPAALFMRRWGYKAGIIAGLCVFSTGTLSFWPAAAIGQYTPFLIALFFVGCGSAMLETASHPFIAQCGAVETSEQRLNFALCFNAPGSITGIIIGAYFILSGIENSPAMAEQMRAAGTYTAYLHMEIMRVVPTYIVIGVVILLYALLIGLIRFPAIQREHEGGGYHGRFAETLHLPKSVGRDPCGVLLLRRAVCNMERLHLLHEAVRRRRGTDGCALSYRQSGGDDSWTLRVHMADALARSSAHDRFVCAN